MKPSHEGKKHFAAFEFYWGLGDDRSLLAVAKQFSVSETAAKQWSQAFDWQRRIDERERRIAEMISQKAEEDALEVRERALKLCRAIQGKFAQRFTDSKDDWKPEVIDFIRALQMELLIMGLPTSRDEHTVKELPGGTKNLAAYIVEVVPENEHNKPFLDYIRRKYKLDHA